MTLLSNDSQVDDFELEDQHGHPTRLTTLLAAGPVVLFFYPAAMSPGCTRESCHFRDLTAEFTAVGAQIVGISADDVAAQARFAVRHRLTYPLLADVDHRVAEMFGVQRRFGPPRRVTFVLDDDRRIVLVVRAEIGMHEHADQALAFLRQRLDRNLS